MTRWSLLLALAPTLGFAQTLELTRSQRFDSKETIFPSRGMEQPALRIRGDNITVDFADHLISGPAAESPDKHVGLGIEIVGRNVTIKNLNLRHYRVGILARKAPGLKLVNCKLTDLYKPRLRSTVEAEDLGDWMSYHQNEKGEWLEKGTGIYLDQADGAVIENCAVTDSLNGLLVTHSDKLRVVDNDFSFNSGVGIGMYRTSDSVVAANRVDFNLRGYSHGIYNRGQDSAGILMYEQCDRNKVAFNSVTHSGDGLFLWAGQSTMDTGKGGCNDNLFAYNDFSHAPTNGIETTFSRNDFIGNLVMECWHGVWGGFSHNSRFAENIFAFNGQAIAIEHGQDNTIEKNSFWRDAEGIVLWAKDKLPEDWGYAQKRDCRSRDTAISNNRFAELSGHAVSVTLSEDISITGNTFEQVALLDKTDGRSKGVSWSLNRGTGMAEPLPKGDNKWVISTPALPIAYVDKNGTDLDPLFGAWEPRRTYDRRWEAPMAAFRKLLATAEAKALAKELKVKAENFPLWRGARGRRVMVVDEWGPMRPDRARPVVVLRPKRGASQSLEILGKSQPWRLLSQTGGPPIRVAGQIPDLITVAASEAEWAKLDFVLAAGSEEVRVREGSVPLTWDVKFFVWEKAADPRTQPDAFAKIMNAAPKKTVRLPRLHWATSGSPSEGVPADYFATMANANLAGLTGDVELSILADDGVRAYLDGELIIDEWRYQGPTVFTKKIKLDGKQDLRIEHFEIDGYTALQVRLRRL